MQRYATKEEISSLHQKMDDLLNKIESLNQAFHEMNNFYLNTFKKDLSTEINGLKSVFDKQVENMSTLITTNLKHGIPDNEWKRRLTQRKFALYESMRNDSIADIYTQAHNDPDVPKIPKKFFKNPTPYQSTMERDLQKDLMRKEVEHEIQRLRMAASVKKDFVDRTDSDMFSLIYQHYDSGTAQQQIHKWNECSEKEANISKLIWDKKVSFFNSDLHLLPIDGPSKNVRRNFMGPFRSNFRPNFYNRPNFRSRSPYFARNNYRNIPNYRAFAQNTQPNFRNFQNNTYRNKNFRNLNSRRDNFDSNFNRSNPFDNPIDFHDPANHENISTNDSFLD